MHNYPSKKKMREFLKLLDLLISMMKPTKPSKRSSSLAMFIKTRLTRNKKKKKIRSRQMIRLQSPKVLHSLDQIKIYKKSGKKP